VLKQIAEQCGRSRVELVDLTVDKAGRDDGYAVAKLYVRRAPNVPKLVQQLSDIDAVVAVAPADLEVGD
jgi:hypothetical protein